MTDRILASTKYLRLVDRDGWFFVERCGGSGVVTIVAITEDRRILLVEQRRPALQKPTIELPAGLAGDEAAHDGESMAQAARRELLEETGYDTGQIELLAECPTSPGLSDEIVSFFLARQLRQVGPGGGVDAEQITVHAVPWTDVHAWLAARAAAGTPVAAKVYAGLYFASRVLGLP